jgi:hypothetical protein
MHCFSQRENVGVVKSFRTACRQVWKRAPQALFVRTLLTDALTLFPALPCPALALLAACATGASSAGDASEVLRRLPSATAFFDGDARLSVIELRGSNALVRDARHTAYQSMVSKVCVHAWHDHF